MAPAAGAGDGQACGRGGGAGDGRCLYGRAAERPAAPVRPQLRGAAGGLRRRRGVPRPGPRHRPQLAPARPQAAGARDRPGLLPDRGRGGPGGPVPGPGRR